MTVMAIHDTNNNARLQVLARLLPLMFDPATEAAPALRQALSVALEAFAGLGAAATKALAGAFLPAARRGLALGLKRGQAPLLLRFMGQLLLVSAMRAHASQFSSCECTQRWGSGAASDAARRRRSCAARAGCRW